jgi:beta-aspartyl-peptidase (threonine type)
VKAIIVHGGAWSTPSSEISAHREGVGWAVRAGWEVLEQGGSALDAVAAAVRLMESDPTFNAGRGANLNAAGEVELDAAIMEGTTLRAGAVAALKGVEHAVELARRVMERTHHVLLVGAGAYDFAVAEQFATCDPATLIVPRERERWNRSRAGDANTQAFGPPVSSDTVGAVACDGAGHLAAASSTGGSPFKMPGRVGDSPLVGSGLYADDRTGAATATGWGEGIMRLVLSKRALDFLSEGRTAQEAAERAISILETRTAGRGGIIAVSPKGEVGSSFNTPHMAHAYMNERLKEPVGAS